MTRSIRCLLAAALLFPSTAFAQDGDAPEGDAPVEEAAPTATPVTYKLKGNLVIIVNKDPDTLGSGLSHDHAIRATGWTGTWTWNTANPADCKVDIEVDVAKLEVDADAMRKAYKLGDPLSAGDRSKIKDAMLGKDQLDSGAHRSITFQSTSCTADKVNGNLTIRGKSKAISMPMKLSADTSSLSVKGNVGIRATDFGFDPFSALFGALKNLNDMKLYVDVTGTP